MEGLTLLTVPRTAAYDKLPPCRVMVQYILEYHFEVRCVCEYVGHSLILGNVLCSNYQTQFNITGAGILMF